MRDTASDLADAAPVNPSRPTQARFVVLVMLCLLSGVLYLDRICMAQAIPSIKAELKLTNTQVSYFAMAFTLAYGLFEIPTGRWGDRIGGRRVLTRISLWWSAFTALTGACNGLWSLIAVRFLFGAGEAGAFPNVARVLSKWFPDEERGRVQGLLLAASQAGGAVSPTLAAILIQNIGWRFTFVVFGGAGAVWAAAFWWWFRDDPASHPAVNAAEMAQIGRRATSAEVHTDIPWAAVNKNPSVMFLSLIMILASFNSYIYFTWFQTYLIEGRSVDRNEAASMASVVLAFSAMGTFAGGTVVNRVIAMGGLTGRRLLGGGLFLSAAGLLGGALLSSDPWFAVLFTALSCCMAQATQPLWWSCAIGISGKHVGALFGLMNSAGVIGAMSSQYLAGAIADFLGAEGCVGRDKWDPIFYINLGVLITAGLLWLRFQFVLVEPLEHPAGETDADH